MFTHNSLPRKLHPRSRSCVVDWAPFLVVGGGYSIYNFSCTIPMGKLTHKQAVARVAELEAQNEELKSNQKYPPTKNAGYFYPQNEDSPLAFKGNISFKISEDKDDVYAFTSEEFDTFCDTLKDEGEYHFQGRKAIDKDGETFYHLGVGTLKDA